MMMRIDENLAFMLRFENVAWFADGVVKILDRRIYPREVIYVTCYSYKDVVKAIQDMVTQSGGPYSAASMGMVLACYEGRHLEKNEMISFMETAAANIANARPTTSTRMKQIVDGAVEVMRTSDWDNNESLLGLIQEYAINEATTRYASVREVGRYLADLIPIDGVVMTQCFADAVIGFILERLKETGNIGVKFITPETRPFLQGARLTASVIQDMGFDVHVITDNMAAYIMKDKKVDLVTSAADMITMDGHIVNKVGTMTLALLANYYGIPYFCTGTPNPKHPTIDTVAIEERNPDEVMELIGTRVTMEGVQAYYPAFDITPPQLVSGIVTNKGVFTAFDIKSYFN